MQFLISLFQIRNMAEPAFVLNMFEQMDYLERISGVEVNANLNDELEVKRLFDYGKLLTEKNMRFQIHSPHGFSKLYNKPKKLHQNLSIYAKLADELNQCLSITIHPVESKSIEKARSRTLKLIANLRSICKEHQFNLDFTLENLNQNFDRLDTDGIRPIVLGSDVNFCWDIGHEVYEDKCSYCLDPGMVKNLNNVHIHDINLSDHCPFRFNRTDYVRAINYLDSIGYDKSVVVEIGIEYLAGDNWTEKCTDYVNQIYLLAETHDSIAARKIQAI